MLFVVVRSFFHMWTINFLFIVLCWNVVYWKICTKLLQFTEVCRYNRFPCYCLSCQRLRSGDGWCCVMVNTPIPHSLRSETLKAAKILQDFTIPSATSGPDKIIPGRSFCWSIYSLLQYFLQYLIGENLVKWDCMVHMKYQQCIGYTVGCFWWVWMRNVQLQKLHCLRNCSIFYCIMFHNLLKICLH